MHPRILLTPHTYGESAEEVGVSKRVRRSFTSNEDCAPRRYSLVPQICLTPKAVSTIFLSCHDIDVMLSSNIINFTKLITNKEYSLYLPLKFSFLIYILSALYM